MKDLLKFLTDNLQTKDFITISVSILALLVSFFNVWKDRKKINIQIYKREPLKYIETYDCVEAYPNQSAGIGIEFRLLNTSKHNIGFFDLVFRDDVTKQILPSFFLYSLRPEIQEQQLLGITMTNQTINLNPLHTNYGTIESNSFKAFGTVVYPTSNKIQVTIKFAKRTLIPNFYSQTAKFAKWKRVVIKLTEEEINIINQYNQQLASEYNDNTKDETDKTIGA